VRSEHDADFADWYSALWPRVLRAVTVSVGDPHLAEEATAEAFARAYARWPAATEFASPQAWLHRVAINEMRSRWRRARVERRVYARLSVQRVLDAAGPEPRDDALWKAVAELPERARQMVAMRYVLDMSEAEIAEAMDVTRGTVASTLSRARQQLSATLKVVEPIHE
jgi:RNA polymerase sigma-70 factor (ECF subfamily)